MNFADFATDIDPVGAVRSTIESIDLDELSDALSDAADSAAESAAALVSAAGEASSAGRRLATRAIVLSGLTMRRHPRITVGAISLIVLSIIVARWLRRRNNDDAASAGHPDLATS